MVRSFESAGRSFDVTGRTLATTLTEGVTVIEDWEGADPLSNWEGSLAGYATTTSPALEGTTSLVHSASGTTTHFPIATPHSHDQGYRYTLTCQWDVLNADIGLIVGYEDASWVNEWPYNSGYFARVNSSEPDLDVWVMNGDATATLIATAEPISELNVGEPYELEFLWTASNEVQCRFVDGDGTVHGDTGVIAESTWTGPATFAGVGTAAGGSADAYSDHLRKEPL